MANHACLRLEVSLCQALASLVTCFCSELDMSLKGISGKGLSQSLVEVSDKVGFLFSMSSLVTDAGKEAGMLGDMHEAIMALVRVRIILEHTEPMYPGEAVGVIYPSEQPAQEDPRRSGGFPISPEHRDRAAGFGGFREAGPSIQVQVGPPEHPGDPSEEEDCIPGQPKAPKTIVVRVRVRCKGEQLPDRLRAGGMIAVHPVLFTVGINEKQTMNAMLGSGEGKDQEEVNNFSMGRLWLFHALFSAAFRHPAAEMENAIRAAQKAHDHPASTKDTVQIQNVELYTRYARGGRATCCKSAKDRTSMSMTAEEGELCLFHGLLHEVKERAVDVFRAVGVRRANVQKNTGSPQYAFNSLQKSCLPFDLRPPAGTYGGLFSTNVT